MRRNFLVFLLVGVLLCLSNILDAAQNLRKTTCPICNMDVHKELNASILGNQNVYACEMAGHLSSLHDDPEANLGPPIKVDITTDPIYKDAKDIVCPVDGKPYSELKYAVPWIAKGGQKIFACSEEHAHMIYSNPKKYIAKTSSGTGFCDAGSSSTARGTVMYNGFTFGIGSDTTCATLFFTPWVLSSGIKYSIGFIAVVLLAISLEAMSSYRDTIEEKLYKNYGQIISQESDKGEYQSMKSPTLQAGNVTGKPVVIVLRRLPIWCRFILTGMYMLHLTLAYLVMLVIMMYEALYFIGIILGIGLGFIFFKEIETNGGGSVDPCCST